MVYQEQTQKHMKNINNIQGSHDINKSQKKNYDFRSIKD